LWVLPTIAKSPRVLQPCLGDAPQIASGEHRADILAHGEARLQLRQQILFRHERQRYRGAGEGAGVEAQEDVELGQGGLQRVRVRACRIIEPIADGLGEGRLAEEVLLPTYFWQLIHPRA
jgi:hypothetical protein